MPLFMRKTKNKITTSKYNKYTFFPLNAYHQCRKPANIFFLLTLFLLCIPQISPFNPYTYLFAFCLVTGTSIVKDGIEDYRKHKQDERINHKKAYIVEYDNVNSPNNCIIKEINVESLDVGDFVIVQEGEDIPADVIVLRSKIQTKKGEKCGDFCYVDSSNLDGESNLKKKTSHYNVECNSNGNNNNSNCNNTTKQHNNNNNNNNINNTINTPIYLCNCDKFFIGNIKNPSVVDTGDLFTKFDCKLQLHENWFLCNEKNVLLKGMKLKNTKSILVYVVAVGQDTKMGRSNISTREGHSLFEGEVSKLVYVIFTLYFILLFVSSLLGSLFLKKNNIEYLYLSDYLPKNALKQTGTNYIMFSYLIPLSLFVTLEVSRIFHSTYVSHDTDLRKDGISSVCRNSSVTEDLGMVEYVLCDKTGTLTKNNMVFKYVHLRGRTELEGQYHCFGRERDESNITSMNKSNITSNINNTSIDSHKFLFILALVCCNGVDFLDNKYEGISQDEISILEGFKMNEIRLLERSDTHILLEIYGEVLSILTSLTLDFTSSRQRMSILVQWNSRHLLFTKGSDTKLLYNEFNNTNSNTNSIIQIKEDEKLTLMSLIETNSKYRTLVVGYRELGTKEAMEFIRKFKGISLENRYQQEEDIFEEYERGLKYLGTTFIEDELQDEVKETLTALKEANIKIWMITGDKKETAISCAIDCGIMDSKEDNAVLVIEGNNINSSSNNNSNNNNNNSSSSNNNSREDRENVGRGSDNTLPNNTLPNFFSLISYKSVVVFRSTPHMKGRIASKFREVKRNTLAVGDGNNDVPMITQANIGVGILGKEGNQAGIAGDFAIPGFSCLRKLILVHGRYNFIRFSKVTLNAFQKNIFFITIQFLYNFFNGFSGRPVYNSYFLNYYNVFFTSLIPATIALFDKDIPEEEAYKFPEKYMTVRTYFSKQVLIFSTFYSIFEGIVIFLLVTGVVFKNEIISRNGKVGGYPSIQNLFSLIVFTSVLLQQINLVSYLTYYTYWGIGLSIGLCFISLFLLGNNMWNILSIPSFYFLFMMLILVSYILGLIQGKIIKIIRNGGK